MSLFEGIINLQASTTQTTGAIMEVYVRKCVQKSRVERDVMESVLLKNSTQMNLFRSFKLAKLYLKSFH